VRQSMRRNVSGHVRASHSLGRCVSSGFGSTVGCGMGYSCSLYSATGRGGDHSFYDSGEHGWPSSDDRCSDKRNGCLSCGGSNNVGGHYGGCCCEEITFSEGGSSSGSY